MNIAEVVFQALTSGSDAVRAYHELLPRKDGPSPGRQLPAIVITQIAGRDEITLRGDGGLRQRLMQLDAWATTRKGAADCAEVARSKLFAAGTFGIGSVQPSGASGYDEEANLYRASYEYSLWFQP